MKTRHFCFTYTYNKCTVIYFRLFFVSLLDCVCVNISFVCFHSGAAVLRPIGEQYRVLCASVNSHIFFFIQYITFILYFGFLYCYFNVLHQFILSFSIQYDIYQLFIDFFSQSVHRYDMFSMSIIYRSMFQRLSALQSLHIMIIYISTIKDTATTHAHL